MAKAFHAEEAVARLDRIQQLTEELAKARGDFAMQQEISERIHRELAGAREALKPLITNIVPL
jgi:hypothetical protein